MEGMLNQSAEGIIIIQTAPDGKRSAGIPRFLAGHMKGPRPSASASIQYSSM